MLFGAIAQMGERLHGMQEVVGSNPIGSIVYRSEAHRAQQNDLRSFFKAAIRIQIYDLFDI